MMPGQYTLGIVAPHLHPAAPVFNQGPYSPRGFVNAPHMVPTRGPYDTMATHPGPSRGGHGQLTMPNLGSAMRPITSFYAHSFHPILEYLPPCPYPSSIGYSPEQDTNIAPFNVPSPSTQPSDAVRAPFSASAGVNVNGLNPPPKKRRRNAKTVVKKTVAVAVEETDTRPYKCEECGGGFSTEWILKRHQKNSCKKTVEYICNFCNTSYSRKDAVKRHQTTAGCTAVRPNGPNRGQQQV